MPRSKVLQLILCFTLLSQFAIGQNADSVVVKQETITLKNQFTQIKDQFNYGLVNSGPGFAGAYSYTRKHKKSTLIINPELGFAGVFNKGFGATWRFKPVDLFYGGRVNKNVKFPLTIGAYVAVVYAWQMYPELQSGHMFWYSTYEAGPQLLFTYPYKDKIIKARFSTSAFGFTSRPEYKTEHHFYALQFSDFAENVNMDQQFGSSTLFNHLNLEIGLQTKSSKKLFFSYEFEFFEYYEEPEASQIFHSINLNWKIGRR